MARHRRGRTPGRRLARANRRRRALASMIAARRYYFAADTGIGAASGQGVKAFGAGWYVVSATGSKIDTS